jgi:hypothetical protein
MAAALIKNQFARVATPLKQPVGIELSFSIPKHGRRSNRRMKVLQTEE